MHLGIVARVPVIAFLGPTSPVEIDLHGFSDHVLTPLAPCNEA